MKKLSAEIHFENLQGATKNPIFERFRRHFTKKWSLITLKIFTLKVGTPCICNPRFSSINSIQGLPSLNVGILPSCREPQIKKNSVKFFANSQFFFANFVAIFRNFLNINVCFKVHSFSYNNSILHNFFYQ